MLVESTMDEKIGKIMRMRVRANHSKFLFGNWGEVNVLPDELLLKLIWKQLISKEIVVVGQNTKICTSTLGLLSGICVGQTQSDVSRSSRGIRKLCGSYSEYSVVLYPTYCRVSTIWSLESSNIFRHASMQINSSCIRWCLEILIMLKNGIKMLLILR